MSLVLGSGNASQGVRAIIAFRRARGLRACDEDRTFGEYCCRAHGSLMLPPRSWCVPACSEKNAPNIWNSHHDQRGKACYYRSSYPTKQTTSLQRYTDGTLTDPATPLGAFFFFRDEGAPPGDVASWEGGRFFFFAGCCCCCGGSGADDASAAAAAVAAFTTASFPTPPSILSRPSTTGCCCCCS